MIAPPPTVEPAAPDPYSPRGLVGRFGERMNAARGQLFAFFFFTAFIFLLYQLYRVFSSFLTPIIWAAILAMLFYPLYLALLARLGRRTTLAAFLLTAFVTAAIVVPTVSLSSVVTRESASLVDQLNEYVR